MHPLADHEITFEVEGPGALRAVGSANPVSEELYVGDHRRVFRGRCLRGGRLNRRGGGDPPARDGPTD